MLSDTLHSPPRINEGIFLIKDVANIIGLPVAKVRFWLTEFWNNRFSVNKGGYSFGDNYNRAVNFYTLIEFITFAKLREQGISAQKLQKFHKILSTELNTPYPFAKTKLLNDKRSVWYEHSGELVKIDGKRQLSLSRVLSPYLNKIEFDKDNIALRYYPLGKNHKIVIDPKHQFGQPTILGTNIKAEIIYFLYKGKETKKNICELYNLTIQQVNDAINYCDKIAA